MLKELLEIDGKWFIDQIKSNIASSGKSRSGKTANSLRLEATEESLIIWGREDFHNIEKGVSPNEAKSIDEKKLRGRLYFWAEYLPIEFENKKSRYFFAWSVSDKLREVGSILFRAGGRDDIYSSEIQPLMDRIKKNISEEIKNIKIVKA